MMKCVCVCVCVFQAALPLGLVPFVFAKEYDLHADMISTSYVYTRTYKRMRAFMSFVI